MCIRDSNDHIKTGLLASHAFNYAHLEKLELGYPPHQAEALFYYFLPPQVTPTFIVPVDDFYDRWIDSVMAHSTQFGDPKKNPQMRAFFESVARQYGRLVRCKYAQAFLSETPLTIQDPLKLVRDWCQPGF